MHTFSYTYVYGSNFTIESDHKPLRNIQHKNLANTPPRLHRMMLRIQPYDFKIVYRPGKEMLNHMKASTMDFDMTIHTIHYSNSKLEEIRLNTSTGSTPKKLLDIVIEGWPQSPGDLPKEIRQFWSCRDALSAEDGILLKGDRVMIPPTPRKEIYFNRSTQDIKE